MITTDTRLQISILHYLALPRHCEPWYNLLKFLQRLRRVRDSVLPIISCSARTEHRTDPRTPPSALNALGPGPSPDVSETAPGASPAPRQLPNTQTWNYFSMASPIFPPPGTHWPLMTTDVSAGSRFSHYPCLLCFTTLSRWHRNKSLSVWTRLPVLIFSLYFPFKNQLRSPIFIR